MYIFYIVVLPLQKFHKIYLPILLYFFFYFERKKLAHFSGGSIPPPTPQDFFMCSLGEFGIIFIFLMKNFALPGWSLEVYLHNIRGILNTLQNGD